MLISNAEVLLSSFIADSPERTLPAAGAALRFVSRDMSTQADPIDVAEAAPASIADEKSVVFTASLFSALAHPTRLRIVEMITQRPRTVGDMASELGILQPNISQHLAILFRAGVVKVTPRGAQRYYSVRGPRIARILALAYEYRAIHAEMVARDLSLPDDPPSATTRR